MIFVCQPFPVALNAKSTSSDSRMLTDFFGDATCGRPLFGNTAKSSAGNTSLAGLNFFKSSLVSSRTSPSSLVKGKCFAMSFSLPLVGFAKTDYSNSSGNRREAEHMQAVIQIPNRNESPFWIQVSVIFKENRFFPIEFHSPFKRQFSLQPVFLGFFRVEFNFHRLNVYTKNQFVKNRSLQ